MTNANSRNAIQQYSQTKTKAGVESASPHRLIQMLLDGALEKVSMAKGAIDRGDINEKGTLIGWAISIIDGLNASLDKESGGEIAENLSSLYEYMQTRLLAANLEGNAEILDEVSNLLKTIKSAWDEIPKEHHTTTEDLSTSVSSSVTQVTA